MALLLSISGSAYAAGDVGSDSVDAARGRAPNGPLPATYLGKPVLWIPKLKRDPPHDLNGKLDHPAWKEAAVFRLTPGVGAVEGCGPALTLPPTDARLFCTDRDLFVGLRCERDERSSKDEEAIHLFIEPKQEHIGELYHWITIERQDALHVKRCHLYPTHAWVEREERWTPKLVYKLFDDPKQSFWGVELRIPYDQLVMSEEAHAKGTLWRMNLDRVGNRDDYPPSFWSWSPIGVRNLHAPACFGYVLPESHSTPELIAQAQTTWQTGPQVSLEDGTHKRVLDYLRLLGDEEFAVREKAQTELLAVARTGHLSEALVRGQIAALVKRSDDLEQKTRALKIRSEIESMGLDEDPPPPELLKR